MTKLTLEHISDESADLIRSLRDEMKRNDIAMSMLTDVTEYGFRIHVVFTEKVEIDKADFIARQYEQSPKTLLSLIEALLGDAEFPIDEQAD